MQRTGERVGKRVERKGDYTVYGILYRVYGIPGWGLMSAQNG